MLPKLARCPGRALAMADVPPPHLKGRHVKKTFAIIATSVFVAGCAAERDKEALAAEWRDCVDGAVIAGWTLLQVTQMSSLGEATGSAIRQCGSGGQSTAERAGYVAGSLKSISENPGGFIREFEARGGHLNTK